MIVTDADGNSRKRLEEDSSLFHFRFCRCHRLLHFIASRILDDPQQARKAVENCWHSASARAPRFEFEGAFRSWLVRVLIDEALLLLGETPAIGETKIPRQASMLPRSEINIAKSNA